LHVVFHALKDARTNIIAGISLKENRLSQYFHRVDWKHVLQDSHLLNAFRNSDHKGRTGVNEKRPRFRPGDSPGLYFGINPDGGFFLGSVSFPRGLREILLKPAQVGRQLEAGRKKQFGGK